MRFLVAVLVMLAAAPAAAGPFDNWQRIKGAGTLEYEASYVHAYDREDDATAVDGLGLIGVRIRAFVGGKLVGYRVGIDLHAGATVPGGFAYDCDLYLLGLGLRLGKWSQAGITWGVGAAGATGTVDDAVLLPVEASLDLSMGSRLRLMARGRVAFLGGANGRQSGAPSLPIGDELDASLAVRLGHRWNDYEGATGNGYYVGVGYRESEGARMIGVIFGHSIDAGTR